MEENLVFKWKFSSTYTIALFSWCTGLITIFYSPKFLLQVGILNYLLVNVLMMVVVGVPITLVELVFSQYSLKSVVRCWDFCPFLRGVGYGKVILLFIFQVYYNVLNSYVLLYCFTSIPEYPNFKFCKADLINSTCFKNDNQVYWFNSEKYWYSELIRNEAKLDVLDLLNWKIVIVLCANMVLIFVSNLKRTDILERFLTMAYSFSIFELIILFCVTNASPGGIEGLKYVILKNPNLNTILVWKEEEILQQTFQNYIFSMGLALGGFSSIASQSSFRKPVKAMTIRTNLANLVTNIVYGLLFVNLYGILQFNTKIQIDDVVKHSNIKYEFDYIFTIIPKAIHYLPAFPLVWNFMFYSSIYLKGLCTSILMTSTILDVINEEIPNLSNHMQFCTFFITLITNLLGLLFLTKFGPVAGQLLTDLTKKVIIPIILTIETTAVIFIYGLLRFMKDLHFMLGKYPTIYWPISLTLSMIIIPIFTSISLICYFKNIMTEFEIALLKAILSLVLVWIPFMGMVRVIRKVKFGIIMRSSRSWGPANGLKTSRSMFEEQHSVQEFLYDKYLLKCKLKKYE